VIRRAGPGRAAQSPRELGCGSEVGAECSSSTPAEAVAARVSPRMLRGRCAGFGQHVRDAGEGS
jgi:hypothetical protein